MIDQYADSFARLDQKTPGHRGPAFQRYWDQFILTCEAEDTSTSYHGHTCDRSQRGQDEDCPGCFGSARVHDEHMRLRRVHSDAQGELWIAARLYESERKGVAEGAKFYVTALCGDDQALLVGPLDTHEEALRMVGTAKAAAKRVDNRAWTYAFGTASLVPEDPANPPRGKLNDHLVPLEEPKPERKTRGKGSQGRKTIAAYTW